MYSRSAKGGENGDPNRNPCASEDEHKYTNALYTIHKTNKISTNHSYMYGKVE